MGRCAGFADFLRTLCQERVRIQLQCHIPSCMQYCLSALLEALQGAHFPLAVLICTICTCKDFCCVPVRISSLVKVAALSSLGQVLRLMLQQSIDAAAHWKATELGQFMQLWAGKFLTAKAQ